MELSTISTLLHRLRCIEQKLTKSFEEETGFSLTRYEILIFLKENGDTSQVEIAKYLDIDPAAITRHIKALETKGFISKKRNENNGREVIISLSAFARQELAACEEKQKESPCEVYLPISTEDLEALTEILASIEMKLK